ncbi:MAG: hypothetical protein PHG67_04975 [Bacteroidales bacterium]|nr:hypothetical protein [Bacteroidales bacterium]
MKDLEKFKKYISGELEEGDLWEFKKSLEVDASLAAEFELFKSTIGSHINKKHQLMNELNDIRQRHSRGRQISISWKRISAIAAGVVILLSIGIGLIKMQHNTSYQALYDQFFIAESASFNVRSATNSLEQPVLDGMQFYELHNYDAAIEMFEKAPNNLMGKLYSGLSMMELGEFEEATIKFEAIIKHNDNLFVDQAEWYQSLCQLRIGNRSNAIESLQRIADDNGVYKTKAIKILKELNEY